MAENSFEAWYDEADSSVAMTFSRDVVQQREKGRWLKQPVFLHRFEAETLEAAVELHQEKMDWDNFWAQKDLVQLCRNCDARYFLRRSISCPNCGHRPETHSP